MYTGHKWSMWSVTQKFLKFYYKVRWAYYIFVGNQHENNHVYMYITYIIYIYIYIYITIIFEHGFLTSITVTLSPNGYNLKNWYCIGQKYQIQNTSIITKTYATLKIIEHKF